MKYLFPLSFLCLLFGWMACNDPTEVGAELLEQDQQGLLYTDTVTIEARTVLPNPDSVRTYVRASPMVTYLCGSYTDPVFGRTTAGIYTQVGLSQTEPDFITLPSNQVQVDSIELILLCDSSAFYGNWESGLDIEVYELAEPLFNDFSYYASQSFATGALIGSEMGVVPVFDTTNPAGVIRIPLDPALGQQFLDFGLSAYFNDSTFTDEFQGIHVRVNSGSADGLLAFTISNLRQISGIYMYTTQEDSIQDIYRFDFSKSSLVKTVHFEYEPDQGQVAGFLDDPVLADSLIFIQGMLGPRVEISLPHIRQLGNVSLNRAELELFATGGLGSIYPLTQKALLADENDSGDFVLNEDDRFFQTAGGQGARPDFQDDLQVFQYSFNITAEVQEMIDGLDDNRLLLEPYLFSSFTRGVTFDPSTAPNGTIRTERPHRAAFRGPGSPSLPMRLKLIYTEY